MHNINCHIRRHLSAARKLHTIFIAPGESAPIEMNRSNDIISIFYGAGSVAAWTRVLPSLLLYSTVVVCSCGVRVVYV